MNRQPYTLPPKRWTAKPNRFAILAARPWRRFLLKHKQQFKQVDVIGREQLNRALNSDHGILITPNHSFHYDSNTLLEVGDRCGCPFHFMTAWQVFAATNHVNRWFMRRHGCFSVDRDGNDLEACKTAMRLLGQPRHPLVIFPEGEIYHCGRQPLPFRSGAAVLALRTARKSDRPISCLPCAISYRFTEDPLPNMERCLNRIEFRLRLPTSHQPLWRRIRRCGEAVLSHQEQRHLGSASEGPLKSRAIFLAESLLRDIERELSLKPAGTFLDRISKARHTAIIQHGKELDRLFTCTQLMSYSTAKVDAESRAEELAEVIEKLEEDVLGVETPTLIAKRRVLVQFGQPIVLDADSRREHSPESLTESLQADVQRMLITAN